MGLLMRNFELMNLRLKIFFLCLLFFIISFKSDSAWVRVQSIAVHNDFFTTDYLGNIYVVNHDQIIKYSPKGEILKRYSNKRLGRIFSIDASNPLRVLVYYKEFSVVVLLDSQLSENGDSISLDQHDLEQCDLVCSSFNNGMWLFNRQNMELIRLNEGLEKVVTTGNLNRLLNFDLHPTRITEQNGFVYLNDPNTGIIIFDIYGTFFKTIPLKNINDLQILDKHLDILNNCLK